MDPRKQRHCKLLVDISNEMDVNSQECGNFIYWIESYAGKGIVKGKNSLLEKLQTLESKGHLKEGDYTDLKNICEKSGNKNLVDLIKEAETDIKSIEKKIVKKKVAPITTKPKGKAATTKKALATKAIAKAAEAAVETEDAETDEKVEETYPKKTKTKRATTKGTSIFKREAGLNSKEPVEKKMKYADTKRGTSNSEREAGLKEPPTMEMEDRKRELRTGLIDHYKGKELQMSAIPLQPESNCNDFKDVYVRPKMTIESEGKKETDVKSMSDIFTNNGKPIKSIYVLGEGGSGKSSFCKSLVSYWCLAHSEIQNIEDDFNGVEDDFNGVREMKKFKFLFLLPLRHFTHKNKIEEMLQEKYKHSALEKLLESEPQTCLVVLDGLDEWTSPSSTSLPGRDSVKNYTVITTSRPWKIGTIGIDDNEIRQKIILTGFDETAKKNMIEKTVLVLNKKFKKNKVPDDCEKALENESYESLKHTAITLQQLICLWFSNKLHGTSRCALYTRMLDMFFEWNKKKHPDDSFFVEMKRKSKDLKNAELPQYLKDTEVCKYYSYIIYGVSQLAYETLFNSTKETSLSFDSSTFEHLKISNELKACCLQLGILSEDKCSSLSDLASTSKRSVFEFVHKSFQEYLAAVYIATSFKPLADSGTGDSSDKCAEFFQKIFSKCTTLDEILEQANVFSMLCGLEPRLATSVSKYIYDIVTRDKRVLEYRRTIDDKYIHIHLISNIQQCILNCIEAAQSSQTNIKSSFYLGDIVLKRKSVYEQFCSIIDKQYIFPDTVMSFRIDIAEAEEYVKRVLKYLQKCRRLEAIHIVYRRGNYKFDDEDSKSLCDTIEGNTSTLKALSVDCCYNDKFKPIYKTVVRRLPDMSHLVALKVERLTVTHEDVTSLCTFLSGTSQLEQISICYIDCERLNQHEVDLSKHQQLQYLEYSERVCVTRVNTSNLEIYDCKLLNNTHCVKVLDNLSTANKLTKLALWYKEDYGLFHRASSDNTTSDHTVTDKLITLLPLLPQLRELRLEHFTFTDNIIKCPSEMKSMKSISLEYVTMSVTTWRKFVDSVPGMPLPVLVSAYFMYITQDGEEYNLGIIDLETEEIAAAWQYVREQKALFDVEGEYELSIVFSTKK